MIRSAWRGITRFLGSAVLATLLLAILGVWSMLATLVPQGVASDKTVAAWAAAHPVFEPVVRTLGLHQAFTALIFIGCVLLLGLSTAVCAWRRTRAAAGRARTLRRAAAAERESLIESHDFEVAGNPALSGPEVLSIASETLERLGIKTKRSRDLVASVSPSWSAWGSPVFHWALLALIVALLVGNLQRSEGLMGVAVGQTRPDAAASYGILHTGPLRDWRGVHRSIRVDAFDLDYKTGGIDRGPTPTVSVLDGAGKVVKTQRVYPNMTLKTGSLTIYPTDYGLSANLSLLNKSGVETGRASQLVDFSGRGTGGTIPAVPLSVTDKAGNLLLTLAITVPLDRVGGALAGRVPKAPTARVVATSADGKQLLDRTISPGQPLALPDGSSLRLDSVGYYARLQVADDGSIPLLYLGLIVAMVGLTTAVVARQQIVLATVIERPEGSVLVAKVRLWRNASSSRAEIESELAKALSGTQEGSGS